MDDLKQLIRDIPDFPKEGIVFRDITPLLANAGALRRSVQAMAEPFRGKAVDSVVGVEARGFIFAPMVAYELGVGFVPVRKPGKLPYKTRRESYELEYGTDALEIHEDAVGPGDRVLMVDDLLATGGTMQACCGMVAAMGGQVVACCFLIELAFLNGRGKLADYDVLSLLTYDQP